MVENLFLVFLVFIFVLLAGLFAGAETGIYQLSRFQLRLGAEQNRRFFGLLNRIMDDSHGLVFSMLVGNNLVHYLAGSIVTFMLLGTSISEHSAELYATVLMTPILFIFSEQCSVRIRFR